MSQFYALFRLTLIPAILLIFNPLANIVNAQEPPQASFTRGIYFYKITTKGQSITGKVIAH